MDTMFGMSSTLLTKELTMPKNSLKKKHIHVVEHFWNKAKPHMQKFNGIPKENMINVKQMSVTKRRILRLLKDGSMGITEDSHKNLYQCRVPSRKMTIGFYVARRHFG